MSRIRTRPNEAQKKGEPLRPIEQKAVHQYGPRPVQTVAPQAVYRHAQTNRNGLTAADVRVIQRTVGNRQTQRLLAERRRTSNQNDLLQRNRSTRNLVSTTPVGLSQVALAGHMRRLGSAEPSRFHRTFSVLHLVCEVVHSTRLGSAR
jgi:hypothetical protein